MSRGRISWRGRLSTLSDKERAGFLRKIGSVLVLDLVALRQGKDFKYLKRTKIMVWPYQNLGTQYRELLVPAGFTIVIGTIIVARKGLSGYVAGIGALSCVQWRLR